MCFAGWGLFEYMRQTYGPGAVDRELSALPAPLPPPNRPRSRPAFGYEVAPKTQQVTLVTLQAPEPCPARAA